MVKHIVMWKLDPAAGDREIVALDLRDRLLALKERISWIRALEVGIDINRGPAARDIVLYTEFDNRTDLDRYQDDPAHREVASFVGTVVLERAVVDYED